MQHMLHTWTWAPWSLWSARCAAVALIWVMLRMAQVSPQALDRRWLALARKAAAKTETCPTCAQKFTKQGFTWHVRLCQERRGAPSTAGGHRWRPLHAADPQEVLAARQGYTHVCQTCGTVTDGPDRSMSTCQPK